MKIYLYSCTAAGLVQLLPTNESESKRGERSLHCDCTNTTEYTTQLVQAFKSSPSGAMFTNQPTSQHNGWLTIIGIIRQKEHISPYFSAHTILALIWSDDIVEFQARGWNDILHLMNVYLMYAMLLDNWSHQLSFKKYLKKTYCLVSTYR